MQTPSQVFHEAMELTMKVRQEKLRDKKQGCRFFGAREVGLGCYRRGAPQDSERKGDMISSDSWAFRVCLL
jgi:hypothetical protein